MNGWNSDSDNKDGYSPARGMMTGYGDVPMSVRRGRLPPQAVSRSRYAGCGISCQRRDHERRRDECETSQFGERFETLSARERQVMFQIATGKMNKQIAAD